MLIPGGTFGGVLCLGSNSKLFEVSYSREGSTLLSLCPICVSYGARVDQLQHDIAVLRDPAEGNQ